MPAKPKAPRWFVYLVRCRDRSLYCGITTDIARRVSQHNDGTGAKYVVKSRRPVECVWKRKVADYSAALKLEYRIKQCPVAFKQTLILKPRTRVPE